MLDLLGSPELFARMLEVSEPPEAIAGGDAMGFRGCLLSGPLEQLALPTLGSVSPAARFAGAVSLVERKADGLFGHMTAGRGVGGLGPGAAQGARANQHEGEEKTRAEHHA
jgi:shikimate 5-dehydrogenase